MKDLSPPGLRTTGPLGEYELPQCLSSCLRSLALSSRACNILDFFSDTPLWRRLDYSNILSVYDLLRLHFDCDYCTILGFSDLFRLRLHLLSRLPP
jgi:hypothetical protein